MQSKYAETNFKATIPARRAGEGSCGFAVTAPAASREPGAASPCSLPAPGQRRCAPLPAELPPAVPPPSTARRAPRSALRSQRSPALPKELGKSQTSQLNNPSLPAFPRGQTELGGAGSAAPLRPQTRAPRRVRGCSAPPRGPSLPPPRGRAGSGGHLRSQPRPGRSRRRCRPPQPLRTRSAPAGRGRRQLGVAGGQAVTRLLLWDRPPL